MQRLPDRALLAALLLLAVVGSGCVTEIFHDSFTLSTSATAAEGAERLGRVRVEQCNYVILVLPIVRDPRDIYDALLVVAIAKGGNALVDFELRGSASFGFFPLFMKSCIEAVGEAALIGTS